MPLRRTTSLTRTLPLVLGVLLLAVLAVLAAVAYYNVKRAVLESAELRLLNVSEQYVGLLRNTVTRSNEQLIRSAQDSLLLRLLEEDVPTDRARIEAALAPHGRDSADVIATEVRVPSRELVLRAGRDTMAILGDTLLLSLANAQRPVIGPFSVVGDSVALSAVVPIRKGDRFIGYVLRWFRVPPDPRQRVTISELVGPGGTLLLGSPSTGTWTDLVDQVEAPPASSLDTTMVEVNYADRGSRLALTRAVGSAPWAVQVQLPTASVLEPAHRFLFRMSLVALAVLVIGLLAMWIVARSITRPVQQLTDAADRFSAGDYQHRVFIGQRNELGRLGAAFNHMAERIQNTHASLADNIRELERTREQFAHAQRMEAVGRLAGGIAHDFNNLLTVILGESELALRAGPEQQQEALLQVRQAGQRAADLTRQLLAFSRRGLIEPVVFDVNDLLEDLGKMMGRLIGEDIHLTIKADAVNPCVRADRGQIEQVILNLVVNARDAMPNGGRLTLETRITELGPDYAASRSEVVAGTYVQVTVTDTGSGMSEEVKAHIFEPFFTTKGRTRGTGLGLATSYGIAKQAGGHLAAYSELGVGTAMHLYLPLVDAEVKPEVPVEEVRRGGQETVLLVEDDEGVRKVASRILNTHGYRVLEARNGEAALELLAARDGPIHLLLTDVVMPGLSGRELAERVTALHPGIRVLFASGYSDDVILHHLLETGDANVLHKPYTEAALTKKVRAVLES